MLAIWGHDLIISEQEFEEGANALIDEQNQFDSKVAEVQSEIGIVNNILNNSTITSKVKLVLVSEGMADERNTLLDMQ